MYLVKDEHILAYEPGEAQLKSETEDKESWDRLLEKIGSRSSVMNYITTSPAEYKMEDGSTYNAYSIPVDKIPEKSIIPDQEEKPKDIKFREFF